MKNWIILFIIIFCSPTANAQTECRLLGIVLDKNNGEKLDGAHILIRPSDTRLITDASGSFSINVSPGVYEILISYVGYLDQTSTIEIRNDTIKTFEITNSPIQMGAIDIHSEMAKNQLHSNLPGEFNLSRKEFEKLPFLFGETDIIRSIRMTPGIQSGGEGNTGIYVRGGNAGQNLFLLDDNPLYNPSHLLGTFPVFNSDAIENASFYKGGIPASYGSRIASVFDISMKEGSYEKFSGSGSLGLIASDLTLQSPFHQGRGSVIISGRRMYLDVVRTLYLGIVNNQNNSLVDPQESFFESNNYSFYDSNVKISYKLSPRNKLFLTAYTGKDLFSVNEKRFFIQNRMDWSNSVLSLKTNHMFNSHVMGSLHVGLTKYDYNFSAYLKNYTLRFWSGILDKYMNLEFIYATDHDINLKSGLHYTHHRITPNQTKIAVNDFDVFWENSYYSDELSGYLNAEFDIQEQFSSTLGIRYTRYRQLGPYISTQHNRMTLNDDTIYFNAGEKVINYHTFDPNLMLIYYLDNQSSLKGALSLKHQFIHLASVGAVTLPSDVWLPSTHEIKPQKAGLATMGYFKNFPAYAIESSVEIFYKKLWNQIELKNGLIDNSNNMNLDENILTGTGEAYGIEFFLKGRWKKATCWFSYTWSKTDHLFENINRGRPFPAKYDRTHDLSLTLYYKIKENWELSSAFIYNTGNAMNLPEGRYIVQGNVSNHYTSVNSYRMPPYHRLDLSVIYHFTITDFIQSNLNFSVYNLYNRRNPYYIYFRAEKNIDEYYLNVKPIQITLFPILPTVTWNFTF